MRAGINPQICVTTTPQPTRLLKSIIADPLTVLTHGSMLENSSNLPKQFIEAIERKYGGTRLGRQEINAELLEDFEGALWSRARLDELRVRLENIPDLRRIVVSVDPAVSSGEESNETGIVAVGLGADGHAYVIDDVSGRYSPTEWAREVVSLYYARQADRVVAERNNGGDLVENNGSPTSDFEGALPKVVAPLSYTRAG